jgi:Cu(I)/Ag(I) efflux system membrane fusion protein
MKQTPKRAIVGAGVLLAAFVITGWWLKDRRQSPDAVPATPAVQGDSTVRLSTDQIRQFGVTFGAVERRVMQTVVRAAGTVTVDETQLTQVTPRFGGFVEGLYVDKTGETVRRGDSLMAIYSPELVAAQQDLVSAATLQRTIGDGTVPGVPGSSTDLVAAARRRLQLWNISDAQIDDVLRSREPHRTLTLYAPASGIVLEKNVVRAQAVQPGQMLYTIANLDVVWIDVALREAEASAVLVGAAARIELAALPGRVLDGHVSYIYPTLDSLTRTVRARITARNSGGLLKPGMYATVTLTSPSRRALTVPTSALFRTGERTVVFVDRGEGSGGRQIVPTEIGAGATTGAYTEVLSGLEAGQQVVTSAQFLLDSESNLAEVMKSMIGQMNTSDVGKAQDMKNMQGMKMPPTTKK